jgi:hypothetical protein
MIEDITNSKDEQFHGYLKYLTNPELFRKIFLYQHINDNEGKLFNE